MDRLIPFIGAHPFWVGVLVILVLIYFVFEIRHSQSRHALTAQMAVMKMNQKHTKVIDIRAKEAFDAGHIVNAVHCTPDAVNNQIKRWKKDKIQHLLVVDERGAVDGKLCRTLMEAGFETVSTLHGGMAHWRTEKMPVTKKGEK